MKLTSSGTVQLLTLDEPHLVLNDDTVTAWNDVLDQVSATAGPASMVITGSGKSFHQGLDLEFLRGLGSGHDDFIKRVHQLFGRLLRLEMPTISAINGHAQAGGAMISLCTDLRIMRADRGWFRLPEIELGMGFPVVMNDLITARIPRPICHRMMVLGERLGGSAAAATGVVDTAIEGAEECVEAAIERGEELAQYRSENLANVRTTILADLMTQIDADLDRDDLFVR